MEGSQVIFPPGNWIDQASAQGVSIEELGTLDQTLEAGHYLEENTISRVEKPVECLASNSNTVLDSIAPQIVSTTNPSQVLSANQLSSTLLQAALFRAVATGNIGSLKLMISAAKELQLLGKTGNLQSLSKIVNYDQRTLLHLAAAEGHLDVVSFLLENRADPYAKDRWGATPIDDAWENGHIKVVETLESFLEREGDSESGMTEEWRQRKNQYRSDKGYDIPLNTGHRPLGAFPSFSLTNDVACNALRRVVSSPVKEEADAGLEQRDRSASCQEDESFTFLGDRFLTIDSPVVDRENDSEWDSAERLVEGSSSERCVSDNGREQEEEEEEEEENQLMEVAQEELDRAYRSEKDKIFQKYRKIIEEKIGSVPRRLRLLSLI